MNNITANQQLMQACITDEAQGTQGSENKLDMGNRLKIKPA
ncbi:hypothetical protein [Pseudoflavitalea sp. G-6-1-2]|nr:hypothetical protein [Pseudoflavitalea sp. G-6-1-2]